MSDIAETIIIWILVSLFASFLVGLIVKISGGPEERANDGSSIITREHDGHKWIVGTIWDNSISIHHHPDCECKL